MQLHESFLRWLAPFHRWKLSVSYCNIWRW